MPRRASTVGLAFNIAFGTDTAALLVREAVIKPSPLSLPPGPDQPCPVTDGRAEAIETQKREQNKQNKGSVPGMLSTKVCWPWSE